MAAVRRSDANDSPVVVPLVLQSFSNHFIYHLFRIIHNELSISLIGTFSFTIRLQCSHGQVIVVKFSYSTVVALRQPASILPPVL
jgi:hypothetical protein